VIITRQRQNVRLVAYRKSAHTSLINAFCNESVEEVTRATPGHRDKKTAAITVSFFRHPLARLVSAYNHLVVSEPESTLTQWGYEQSMDFHDFIALTLRLPDKEIDLHLASQSYQLSLALEDHHTDVVWIGQVEEAMSDWHRMMRFTGLRLPVVPLPTFNRKAHPPWPMYYTPELIRDVLHSRYMGDHSVWETRHWR
jgi:hypothetical protein